MKTKSKLREKKIMVKEFEDCYMCEGTGVWEGYDSQEKYADLIKEPCDECSGTGKLEVENE